LIFLNKPEVDPWESVLRRSGRMEGRRYQDMMQCYAVIIGGQPKNREISANRIPISGTRNKQLSTHHGKNIP
jgi:hypothetical protein